MCRSVRHTPHARTRRSTCPGPGFGSGTTPSRSGPPRRSSTIARTWCILGGMAALSDGADVRRSLPRPAPYDLAATVSPLCRGTGDPTTKIGGADVWRTLRTPEGPATLHVVDEGGSLRAEAWGPGAESALDSAPGLLGLDDDPSALVPQHRVIAELAKRNRGVRLTRSGSITPTLVAAILEQKVTGLEARRAWQRLVRATSDPAPGPRSDLLLPPHPVRVCALPYHDFHPFGVERRRAETVRRVAARSSRIDALMHDPVDAAKSALLAIPGVGPWTVAEVARLSFGDPDALSVGDYHLPHLVSWALAGEPRGTDERMLELLEPYRGQRGRVQRLLEAGHSKPPAFG